jgi:hypothetical protein
MKLLKNSECAAVRWGLQVLRQVQNQQMLETPIETNSLETMHCPNRSTTTLKYQN